MNLKYLENNLQYNCFVVSTYNVFSERVVVTIFL